MIIVVSVISSVGLLAITAPSGEITVYEEMCVSAYGPAPVNRYLGANCESPKNPVPMPATFNLATVVHNQNGTSSTLREAYFAVFLTQDQVIKLAFSSDAPVTYNVYFDNRTSFNTSALSNEAADHSRLLEGSSGTTTDSEYLRDNYLKNGWYIFQIFGGQLGQSATLTFNIQPSSSQEAQNNPPPPQQ